MPESNAALSKPPDGVIAGEDVPADSEPDEYDKQVIQEAVGLLKSRSQAFRQLTEHEQRKKSMEILRKNGVDL